jgi:cell division protease FtsH
MAQQVDIEVRAILENALDEAHTVLNLNRRILDRLAKELLERETLNQDEIAKIFKTVKKLPERDVWRSSQTRSVTAKGPIAVPKRKVKPLEALPEAKPQEIAEDAS